jgi:hypothetical protein
MFKSQLVQNPLQHCQWNVSPNGHSAYNCAQSELHYLQKIFFSKLWLSIYALI